MTKILNFAEIVLNLSFTRNILYEEYLGAFERTNLGRMKSVLSLREMAKSFGLLSESLWPKRGRWSYFTPEGKVAIVFLKMKTQKIFPNIPIGQWHGVEVLESGTVILECKDGAYEPQGPEDIMTL